MKVKDLERTANVAWSPENESTIYLSAGTAAQQLDATFNTSALLEIYSLNLTDPSLDLELKASIPSEDRFHKLIWGPYSSTNGTIVGGCDGGVIQIYNATKILNGENGLVSKIDKHTGTVHTLDFNPFQSNLLASGASESEIYIWDMNKITKPMTPGTKSQPFEDVLSIAWNKQVQHILASTFSSKSVVWDLRKNEPVIKLMDTVSRIRWKAVAWHPEVATQLCLASEEDHSPVIQLWDLRFATSPLKSMENHQRGILSIAWCVQDSDLLISCSKDNRILCWNPNSNKPGGEVLSEIAQTNQWNFDVAWCPKNPALIASSCFDGHVSIYSIMGGKTQQIQTTNKIADSFPGMDGYVQAPIPQQGSSVVVSVDLTKPPKWLKKPIGASFGFGGKLITFENEKILQNQQPGEPNAMPHRTIYVSQVITENELVNKSKELEQALEYGNFIEYCRAKADISNDQHTKYIWHFIKANFEENSRMEILNLLGYKIEDVHAKLNQFVEKADDSNQIADDFNSMTRIEDYNDPFANVTNTKKELIEPYHIKISDDTEGLIAEAILLGNIEAAVELCLKAKRFADAIIISMKGGNELFARTQSKYLNQSEGYVSSLISALVSRNWSSVISNCHIDSWKEALCAILTHSTEEELPTLCELLGNRLEQESCKNIEYLQDAQLCFICSGNFEKLVTFWSNDAQKSTHALQELVELVILLQKALERKGKKSEINDKLADLLTNYSFILASQGNLQTALHYLGNSQNEQVATLRERLFVALGRRSTNNQASSRKSSTRSSFSNYPNPYHTAPQYNQTNYNQFNAGLSNPSWQTQNTFNPPPQSKPFSPPPTATIQQQQPPSILQPTSLLQPTPNLPPTSTLQPSIPPPTFMPAQQYVPPQTSTALPSSSTNSTLPPRPPSTGSGLSSSGLPPRTKYVVDPSVQSNQYGIRNNFSAPSPLLPAPIQQAPINPSLFQTNAVTNVPLNNNINNNNNVQQSLLNPLVPHPLLNNNPLQPNNMPFNQQANAPGMMQGNQATAEMAQSAMNVLPANAAHGWNDPPAFQKTNRLTQRKHEVITQDPITHPLYGTAPNQNNIYDQSNQFGYNTQQSQEHQQQQQQMYQQSQPLNPMAPQVGFMQMNFNNNPINSMNDFNQQQSQAARPETPQNVPKAPIPEEHIHMQTVLDELKTKCATTAHNPQLKRKIDDVGKKLESLYDLLRDRKLSSNTLASLHQIVQLIQNGDYMGGLNLHTQLVSGPDFAQIASFMPGLKVLLQSANQLQVYIR